MSRISLTFDNGPEPGVTDQVLDALRARGLAATFFVIGQKLATPAGRRLASRARDEGHKIGNHTFSHSVPLGLTENPDAAENEIGQTQRLLGDLAPDRLFRPNGNGRLGPHLLSRRAVSYLAAGGFTCVTWSVLPRDWEEPDSWVERALRECSERTWSVVVLHDLPTGAMRRLPDFLDKLGEHETEIRSDFPDDCLPIVRGRLSAPLKGLLGNVNDPLRL
jgi:peptidoglycan/xylan/chitin deacetylase (PgdA/CDA1 family)